MSLRLLAFAIALTIGPLALPAAAALTFDIEPGPIHACGIFVSYEPAIPSMPGALVIGTTTYSTSPGGLRPGSNVPTPFTQLIDPAATRGSQVCLDGTIAPSLTPNLLTDFRITPAQGSAASPQASPTRSAPASASPSPVAQPAEPTGPSTSPWITILIALGIGVTALATWLIRRRQA